MRAQRIQDVSIQSPISWLDWLVLAAFIFFVHLCCELGLAGQQSDARQFPIRVRQVGTEEIAVSRGEVEDDLREAVLGAFENEAHRTRLRQILNRPWDRSGIEYLWGLVLQGERKGPYDLRVTIQQQARILELMAYVHATYRGNEKKKEAVRSIRTGFDSLFETIAASSADWPLYHRAKLYAIATGAIKDYGTADLLGSGFWDCFETWDQGFVAMSMLEKVGNKDTLERMKRIQSICRTWGLGDRISMLEKTIGKAEARLLKEGETRER